MIFSDLLDLGDQKKCRSYFPIGRPPPIRKCDRPGRSHFVIYRQPLIRKNNRRLRSRFLIGAWAPIRKTDLCSAAVATMVAMVVHIERARARQCAADVGARYASRA
jgi:hypothetical protein